MKVTEIDLNNICYTLKMQSFLLHGLYYKQKLVSIIYAQIISLHKIPCWDCAKWSVLKRLKCHSFMQCNKYLFLICLFYSLWQTLLQKIKEKNTVLLAKFTTWKSHGFGEGETNTCDIKENRGTCYSRGENWQEAVKGIGEESIIVTHAKAGRT